MRSYEKALFGYTTSFWKRNCNLRQVYKYVVEWCTEKCIYMKIKNLEVHLTVSRE